MNVQLVLFKEDGTRRDLDMKRDAVVIGRSGDCDFQIPLAVISRRHCKLSKKGERLIVKDLGSSNGTFLNDKRVLQAEAKAGDQMKVGPVIFTIVIDGKPSEIEPVITVLNPAVTESAAPAAASESSIAPAPAPAVPDASAEPATDGSARHSGGIDIISDLEGVSLDDSKAEEVNEEVNLEDSGLSPLAELEELAKQRKK
ncbi:MAG TPA: FHA domain-containing protein [Urbifossiella sp.]